MSKAYQCVLCAEVHEGNHDCKVLNAALVERLKSELAALRAKLEATQRDLAIAKDVIDMQAKFLAGTQSKWEEAERKLADMMRRSLESAEPVAWMNPHGGVLQIRQTGMDRETHTIPLYLAAPAAAPEAVSVPEVWALSTRTYSVLFATEQDANKFQRANGVGASTYVTPIRMPVISLAAAKEGKP